MTAYNLFPPELTPFLYDAGDPNDAILGVRFKSDIAGWVTGVRFYKNEANYGPHTGHLWTGSGALLASVTFTDETATGWQTAYFDDPVALNIASDYVATYRAPHGHYSATSQFFNIQYDNAPLHGISTAVSANGTYHYVTGGDEVSFPEGTFNAANYFVDVVFVDTLNQNPSVSFKSRESEVWVPRTAVPKVRQSGAWVNAQPKRWTGTAWVDLT